jgi:SHS2 domain-containing protein
MTFRFLEHTADVVLEVESTSFGELLAEAARGFTDCITDVELVRPRQRIEVTTGAPDREGLLVGWLNELLFRFEAEGFLACAGEVEVRSEEGTLLAAGRLRGEPYDPERHPFRTAVKGATWHNLNIESDGRDWHAVVVLDV